jgi:signal transduction histidine kinase
VSQRWFLHRRITLAFALTTFFLSSALALPFGTAVHETIQEEVTALAREELDETRAYFLDRRPSAAEFAPIAAEMEREHPTNPLAWRIWDASGAVWSEFGRRELLVHAPQRPARRGVQVVAPVTRVASGELSGGMTAAVVLDAHAQQARFTHFLWAAAGFVLLATALSTLAGHQLARRVALMLGQVAESARSSAAGGGVLEPRAAPEEIRAVVQALDETLKRIREESERTRLLVSGLAHELRSPLQNLVGQTQVALLREREAGEYRRVLESHLEDFGELSRVVDNLVTLASVEEARRQHTVERFDLAEEGRLRLSNEVGVAARRGVELRLDLAGPLWIEGDRESLLLALRNVVTNAIEWSPSGKPIDVSMRADGSEVVILVDDAGPGVPPAERERIFRPFQSGKAASGRRAGFGLGLALTFSAVRAQGGRIEVESSPAGGARFRLRLPVERH